jgi:hypothetical protein
MGCDRAWMKWDDAVEGEMVHVHRGGLGAPRGGSEVESKRRKRNEDEARILRMSTRGAVCAWAWPVCAEEVQKCAPVSPPPHAPSNYACLAPV